MAQKTQGTELFTIDPTTGEVLVVGCVISIDGIDTTLDQLETTCLSSPARTYEAGLATPGSASFGINFDPKDASHVRLHQLKVAGTTLHWAIGFGDGPRQPDGSGVRPTADTSGEFVLPTTRSWITFDGFMNSYPFSFALNAVVTSTVGIQISGEPAVIPKTP
jgi:hypothetical protein